MKKSADNKTVRHARHDGVPPIIDDACDTLVLGSILSPKSEQAAFYYAHPQNRFWRVLSAIFETDYPTDKDKRAKLALDNGIALWDVVAACDIAGASDNTITNVVFNDIAGLLLTYPNINRIFTTGGKAHELLMRYNASHNIDIISRAVRLPSTSPQNCKIGLNELIAAYTEIKQNR